MECKDRSIRDVLAAAAAMGFCVLAVAGFLPGRALAAPRSGVVLSFGEGVSGQLGVGTTEMANATPREVSSFEHEAELPGPEPRERTLAPNSIPRLPIVAVAAGGNFSLAVTAPGEVDAFGDNEFRQLAMEWGDGTETVVDQPTVASLPLKPVDGTVAQVAAGADDGFAVTSTGMLFAWGLNDYGQLGVGTGFEPPKCTAVEGIKPKAVTLPGEERSAQVAAGQSFALVLTQAGRVFGFGSNQYGQLGNSKNFQSACAAGDNEPQEVVFPPAEGGERIVDIAAGLTDGLAVTAGGRLFAFGGADYGATGRASQLSSDEPTEIPLGGEQVSQVAAGGHSTLILTRAGAVYSLGQNRYGQLGRSENAGTNEVNSVPGVVKLPIDAGAAVHVAAGEKNALVVTNTGRLYTFGDDYFGQLGWTLNVSEPATPLTTFKTNEPNWFPQPVSLPGRLRAEDAALGPVAQHALLIAGEPIVQTAVLAAAHIASRYHAELAAAGGRAPYTWTASGLPRGITLNGAEGLLSGRPRRTGRYTVHVEAVDAFGIHATATLHLRVASRGPGIAGLRMAPLHWLSRGHLSFRLSRPATVHVHICALSARRCRPVATIDDHLRRGLVRLSISRRPGGRRRLPPGSYELYVTASDRAGTTSSRRLAFTVG